MKTSWKDLIYAVKKMSSKEYKITVTARHYLISAYDNKFECTFSNKWRAMLNMKLYAIFYDLYHSDDYGIYYNIKEIKDIK